MKVCTWCGKEYSDDAAVCDVDEQSLRASSVTALAESSLSSTPSPRRDPLATVAFVLALVIMVLPLEADLLDPVFRRSLLVASFLAVLFFGVVFTPFILAVRRRYREPFVRSGKGLLVVTGAILILNIVWFSSVMLYQLSR